MVRDAPQAALLSMRVRQLHLERDTHGPHPEEPANGGRSKDVRRRPAVLVIEDFYRKQGLDRRIVACY
jgi:hypothetical protein